MSDKACHSQVLYIFLVMNCTLSMTRKKSRFPPLFTRTHGIVSAIANFSLKGLYTRSHGDMGQYRNCLICWGYIPYSLDNSPGLIRVLTRIQSRKLELLFNKKWQKLEYDPAQKIKKIKCPGL